MKFGRSALAGLLLAGAVAGKASAATNWGGNGGPYCGGNTFSTCFSVNLSWTTPVSSTNTLTVTLKLINNDATAGLKWFSVGLDNLTGLSSFTTTGPAGWSDPPPNDFSGGPFITPTASAVNNGGEAASDFNGPTGGTWTFALTMGSSLTGAQWDALLNAAGVGLHAGGLTINNTSCSTKVIVRDNLAAGSAYGTNRPDGSAPLCESGSPPTEITPEPMSITLMATGLVGLAGAGFIKRRRSNKV